MMPAFTGYRNARPPPEIGGAAAAERGQARHRWAETQRLINLGDRVRTSETGDVRARWRMRCYSLRYAGPGSARSAARPSMCSLVEPEDLAGERRRLGLGLELRRPR